MLNIFKNKDFAQEVKLVDIFKTVRPNYFRVGQVYMMQPGYHTRYPYYIMIEDVGGNYIITTIPDKHSLKITYPSLEWNYHIPRMTYMGNISNDKIKKLLNQPSLPYNKQ